MGSFRTYSKLSEVLERGLPVANSKFVNLVLSHYSVNQLYGMSIKDKRGGKNNIHSWDIDYKGETTKQEKEFLNLLLKERRKKKWAVEYGIDWMDGMPLTLDMIRTFYNSNNLEVMLEDLVSKKYLKKEHPKKKVGNKRVQDESLPLGYNIVAGKMSYEVAKVLDPNGIAPTLVAMDMEHLFVGDNGGIRKLSLREGLRLFGYPDDFKFNVRLFSEQNFDWVIDGDNSSDIIVYNSKNESPRKFGYHSSGRKYTGIYNNDGEQIVIDENYILCEVCELDRIRLLNTFKTTIDLIISKIKNAIEYEKIVKFNFVVQNNYI